MNETDILIRMNKMSKIQRSEVWEILRNSRESIVIKSQDVHWEETANDDNLKETTMKQ